jgi:hypothetical protein
MVRQARQIKTQLFDGFALDMASEMSGLSKGEIRWLGQQRILGPEKDAQGSFKYNFSELLMLRVVRLLKLNRVKVKDIKKARGFIREIDPTRDLTNIQLYVRSDTREILYVGEEPQRGVLVNMSQFGQLIQKNLLTILPIGRDLEHMKQEIVDLDQTLASRVKSKKLVSLDDVFKKYGVG